MSTSSTFALVALSLAFVALAPACGDSASPTEPLVETPSAPTPTATPVPAHECAQIAGSYFRGIADSTCLGLRHAGGPDVREVAPCVFEADDAKLQARVTLTAVGNSGTVTLAWWACTGSATGRFEFADGNVVATFAGVADGSHSICCGNTSGSFQWIYRR